MLLRTHQRTESHELGATGKVVTEAGIIAAAFMHALTLLHGVCHVVGLGYKSVAHGAHLRCRTFYLLHFLHRLFRADKKHLVGTKLVDDVEHGQRLFAHKSYLYVFTHCSMVGFSCTMLFSQIPTARIHLPPTVATSENHNLHSASCCQAVPY